MHSEGGKEGRAADGKAHHDDDVVRRRVVVGAVVARQHAPEARARLLLLQLRGARCIAGAAAGWRRDLDHVGEARVDRHDVGVLHAREHRHLHRVGDGLAVAAARVHDLPLFVSRWCLR